MISDRILFYVQHLKGVGHVFRAKRIIDALIAHGFDVVVALGGPPISTLSFGAADVRQLPPIFAAPDGFSDLVDQSGQPIDNAFKAGRREQLVRLLDETAPAIVITEAYPFARRQMRFELLPLLEHAHAMQPRPLVVSSVRDILQRAKSTERARESVEAFNRWFDHLLVHGDPSFIRLEASYPEALELADRTYYTGIVAPPGSQDAGVTDDVFDVIVSAGGGAVGQELLAAAIAAKPRTSLSSGRWLVLAGPNLADDAYADTLAAARAADVTLERFRPNLGRLMAKARLSVQQAGYNTVADLSVAGCRAVLIPFAVGGETEQTERAQRFVAAGRAVALSEAELSAETLAAAIDAAMLAPLPEFKVDLDGANASAVILRRLLDQHRTRTRTTD